MSASTELATFLAAEVGALTLADTLFVDRQPAGKVNSARLVQYPGAPPEHRMDGTNEIRFTFPNLQFRVRNEDDATAFTIAEAAASALGKIANQTIEGTFYRSVNLINQPGLIERDSNDLIIVGFSAQAERRAV